MGWARPARAQVLEKIGVGKDTPVFLTSWPGNPNLLLIVERGSGKITKMLVKDPIGPPGTPINLLFLDLSGKAKIPVSSIADFAGVTAIVFHPEFASDRNKRYVYVRYNAQDESAPGVGDQWRMIIERYHVPAGTGCADPSSGLVLYTQVVDTPAPPQITHNSGQIHFDTIPGSRRLYCAMPDDALGPPTTCLPEMHRAQDDMSDLGKLLAFNDIDADPLPPPTKLAKGLRNPFGFSVDSATGDVWIGNTGPDCGGDVFRWPSGTAVQLNYGWPCKIGDCKFGTGSLVDWVCDPNDPMCQGNSYTEPEYIVQNQMTGGAQDALLGGYVYHGSDFPAWDGKYIFALHKVSRVFLLDPPTGNLTEITASLGIGPGGFPFQDLSLHGFGQDEEGELYIIRVNPNFPSNLLDNGTIFKIVP